VRHDAARLAPRIDGQTPAATLFQKEGHMRQMMKIAKYVFVVALFSLLSMGSAVAQENAELDGTVSDPTGAAVPRAQVTITNTATSEVRTGTTNGEGLYDFPGMRIGTYTLSVTAAGFETYSKTDIVMNVAATVRENVALVIGASSQTVSVEADALHLQSDTNEVSNLITGEQMTQLATDGRNMVSLATLGTGVANNLSAFNGVSAQTSGFGLSFNGMRPDHNDWLVDGGEAYDRGSGGKFDLMPSPDVMAEFQTLSSNYSPDYGISSGGTIVTVLKSGTNQFHGGLWEFNRNDDFDAIPYFSKNTPGAPIQIPELRLNIFGGEIGGPVFIPKLYPKDRSKTFFFWSEEWRKFISGVNPSQTATVPNADFPTAGQNLNYVPWNEPTNLANGVCNAGQPAPCVPFTQDPAKLALYAGDHLTQGNAFPGNVIPANLLDPNAVLFMGTGAIPHQTNTSVTAPTETASPNQPTYVREDVVRADHDITPRLHLMGHWIHDAMVQTIIPSEWSGSSYDTVGTVFANPSWASVIKLSQTLTPSILNETALNVNGNTINWTPTGISAQPAGWTAQSFTGFAGNAALKELPQVGFSGNLGTEWSENYDPWRNAFLDYQVKDDLSWEKGKHGFKFGVSYMRVDKNQQQQALVQGQYKFGSDFSGDSYLNFLLGNADSFEQLQNLTTPHWLNNTYSFYAMDNWRITPRLTLNLGFRYDFLPHVYEKNNQVANFVPADFNPAEAQTPNTSTGSLNANGPGFETVNGVAFYLNGTEIAGQNGFPRGIVDNDYFTPEPRIGFAYDLFGTGKTILRGGSGMFYERVQGNDIYGLDINSPFAFQPTANEVNFTNPNQSATTGQQASEPEIPAGPGSLNVHYPNPATFQYSLGLQQQLQPGVIAVIQYVGSAGWDQSDQLALNPLPLADLTDRQAVAGGANPNFYRTYRGYASINQSESESNSNYNSLQAGLRFTSKHNLTGQLSYTWSHEIDIASGDENSTGQSVVSDPFNLKYDRGSGTLDRRHIFSANYDYRLPFFQAGSNLFAREVLGGWELSGVTVAQAGSPANVTYNGPDTIGLGGDTTIRPNLVGSARGPKTQKEWFNTAAFSNPVAPWNNGLNQGFGSAGKDAAITPGLFNWNIALFKSIALTSHEGPRVEIRFESYNTFNHTEFQNLDVASTDANFGQATSTYDPRVFQFGGKFLF
jgi:Carboxypeptidase regulatory-like domain